MLRKLSTAEKLAALLDQFAVSIRDAFLNAIADIRSAIVLSLVVQRIEAGDVEGAVRAMAIEAVVFNPMLDEIAAAYSGGGIATIDGLPALASDGYRLILRFDARNSTAEAWLRDHSATLVREIVDDQIASIRAALTTGMARGISPRQVALDIIGRIDRVSGRRVGGIVGLTSSQAEWVRAYEAELRAGDKNALTRNLRDRRFDKTVRAAIADGKPIPAETIGKMVTAYENRALRYRGEAIGRTESLTALNSASGEAMRQVIADGKVDASLVMQKWNTILDGRERDSHEAMDGQIKPWGQPFISGAGYALRYPGDPLAPASETINCFPAGTMVRFAGIQKAFRHWYEGDLIKIVTASGNKLTGTPNHPVLTSQGWVGLGFLKKGDDVFGSVSGENVPMRDPYVNDMPSGIEQVFDALSGAKAMVRCFGSGMHFHGDVVDCDVDIVATAGFLPSSEEAGLSQSINDLSLSAPDEIGGVDSAFRSPGSFGIASDTAGRRQVRGADLAISRRGTHSRPLERLGLGLAPDADIQVAKDGSNGRTLNAEALCDSLLREAFDIEFTDGRNDVGMGNNHASLAGFGPRTSGDAGAPKQIMDSRHRDTNQIGDFIERSPLSVEPDRVVKVSKVWFRGHVFNLQTESGTYIANGVLVHNCRCARTFTIRKPELLH